MKFFLLPLFLLPILASAQDCSLPQYQKLLLEASQSVEKGQYDLALNKLQSAKICRPEKEPEVNRTISSVFQKINAERIKARQQEQEAQRQKEAAEKQQIEAEKQRDLAEIQRKRAEQAKQLAEKKTREIANTALYQALRDKSPTLALALARYNLLWYADNPNAVSNLYNVLYDSSAVFFEKILNGHKKDIKSLAFSADGKYLASVGEDHVTIIWDVVTWKKIALLENTYGEAAFSPDSKKLAVGTPDSTVVIWESGTWAKTAVLKTPEETGCLAFSSDNKYLATGSGENTQIWDILSWKQMVTLNVFKYDDDPYLDSRFMSALEFSPDNKYLLTLDEEQVKVWETSSWKTIAVLKTTDAAVNDLAFSIDGKYLATGHSESLTIWDTHTWKPIRTLEGPQSIVFAVAFSPNGKYLAAGSRDNTARIWSVEDWREAGLFKGHQSVKRLGVESTAVSCVAFSADSKHLATGSIDKSILIWAAESRKYNPAHKVKVTEEGKLAAFSPDGKYMAVTTDYFNHNAVILNTGTWDTVSILERYKERESIKTLKFSVDGKYVAAGFEEGVALVWETITGKQRHILNGQVSTVDGIAFSPNGQFLATSSLDKSTVIWDLERKEIVNSWESHRYDTEFMTFSPDGRLLIQGSGDSTCTVWEMKTGNPVHVIENQQKVLCAAFSPDGKYVALGGWGNKLKVWACETWELIWESQEHRSSIRSLAYTPDGKFLASGSTDKTIKIWDAADGKVLGTLKGTKATVEHLAFSTDGQLLYTFSYNKTAGTFKPFEDCVECRAYDYPLSDMRAAGLQAEPSDLLALWKQGVKLTAVEQGYILAIDDKNK